MAKVTLVFAVLLIALGAFVYLSLDVRHISALIPAGVGLLLGIFGFLAMSEYEERRRLFMHVNVMVGLVGFLGAFFELARSWRNIANFMTEAKATGVDPGDVWLDRDLTFAVSGQGAFAGLMAIYVIMCIISFISARRSGRA